VKELTVKPGELAEVSLAGRPGIASVQQLSRVFNATQPIPSSQVFSPCSFLSPFRGRNLMFL
jgi:hypothetical protein